MDSRSSDMPKGLFPIHQDIFANVMAGDPTPFKPFRRNEYRLTLDRFGRLEDRAPVDQMLEEEVIITEELRQMAQIWKERGGCSLAYQTNRMRLPCHPQSLREWDANPCIEP